MNQNELPDEEKIDNIFFDEDDRKEIDLDRGRPPWAEEAKKKKEEQNKKVEKPQGSKHSSVQKNLERQEDLIKQAKFLRKFEERFKKLEEDEKKQKKFNRKRRKQKEKVKERKKQKEPKKIQAVQGELKELVDCQHEDVFEFFDGQIVRSKCKHCSREKTWSPEQWRKRNPVVPSVMNPSPSMFPF